MMKLENLTDKEYRKIKAESYSSLKSILKSPKDFLYYKEKPFKGNAATVLGTVVHHYIQKNSDLVLFKPDDRTKEGKEAFKEVESKFFETKEDGVIAPLGIKDKVETILANCKEDTKIMSLLDKCTYEVGFQGKIGHLDLKGKLDGYHSDYIIDIKSTSRSIDKASFRETCYSYDYDMQAAMYLNLSKAEHNNYYFVVCCTAAPYNVALYKASEELINSGKKKLKLAIEYHKRYIIDGNEWETPIEEI